MGPEAQSDDCEHGMTITDVQCCPHSVADISYLAPYECCSVAFYRCAACGKVEVTPPCGRMRWHVDSLQGSDLASPHTATDHERKLLSVLGYTERVIYERR